jgi:Kef-type K+ transport system membrane component KefB
MGRSLESRFSINKTLLSYLLLLVFGAGIWFVLEAGARINRDRITQSEPAPPPDAERTNESDIVEAISENLRGPLSVLLMQIILITLVARFAGRLFLKIGQPAVIGEMIAGIMLGPSLLGAVSPGAMTFLFPASSMSTLQLLSQIGVILFMFVVGMELNDEHFREKAHAAILVSHASIVIPFFLGAALSLFVYRQFASAKTSFTAFALFMGIAMSITAFPVLARIIEERGMSKSYLGSTAIACAAVGDVTAWCILAVVVAIAQAAGIRAAMMTIVLTAVFIAGMLFLIRPRLAGLIAKYVDEERRSKGLVAGILAFVFASAWVTETIGIHALFGAFLAGVVMPSVAGFRAFLREKLETFSTSALLPLFFAFTGLRTEINMLDDLNSWLMCLAIIAVAVAGKLVGSMLMARWTGMSWHDSFSIGVLMNTRGLMELVVLNIGYDLGILPAKIFAMMVIMAMVTTSMAGPLLTWVKFREQTAERLPQSIGSVGDIE